MVKSIFHCGRTFTSTCRRRRDACAWELSDANSTEIKTLALHQLHVLFLHDCFEWDVGANDMVNAESIRVKLFQNINETI